MTLIAAFRSADGVVLCADQQETVGDVRVSVNKLQPQECGEYWLALAGSGNGDLIDGFAYKLRLDMERWQAGLDETSVYGNLTNLVQDYHSNEVFYYPADSADNKLNDFLVCIKPKESESIFLWTVRGTAVAPIGDYVLLGIGAAIYEHELKKLNQPGARWHVSRTLLLGLHLFVLAKATSNYIGGKTDAIVVNASGMITIAESVIQELEFRLQMVNERIAALVLACPDLGLHDGELKAMLAVFGDSITMLRDLCRLRGQEGQQREIWG